MSIHTVYEGSYNPSRLSFPQDTKEVYRYYDKEKLSFVNSFGLISMKNKLHLIKFDHDFKKFVVYAYSIMEYMLK